MLQGASLSEKGASTSLMRGAEQDSCPKSQLQERLGDGIFSFPDSAVQESERSAEPASPNDATGAYRLF